MLQFIYALLENISLMLQRPALRRKVTWRRVGREIHNHPQVYQSELSTYNQHATRQVNIRKANMKYAISTYIYLPDWEMGISSQSMPTKSHNCEVRLDKNYLPFNDLPFFNLSMKGFHTTFTQCSPDTLSRRPLLGELSTVQLR